MVWYADGIRAVLCGKEARAGSFASAGRPRREAGPTSQGSCAARVRVRVVKILPSTALAASAAALAATLAVALAATLAAALAVVVWCAATWLSVAAALATSAAAAAPVAIERRLVGFGTWASAASIKAVHPASF